MAEIKIGDVVKLKGGSMSPKMTVNCEPFQKLFEWDIKIKYVDVIWFDKDSHLHQATFATDALEVVSP